MASTEETVNHDLTPEDESEISSGALDTDLIDNDMSGRVYKSLR